MSLRDSDNGESLDLLLDTLCNTFAALIFIAILLIIINRDATTPKDGKAAAAVDEAKIELLQRQIANLTAEVSRLSSLSYSAEGASSDADLKIAEDLQKEIQKLESRLRALETALAAGQKALGEGAKNDVEALRAQADRLHAELTRLATANKASNDEAERLTSQRTELEKQLADAKLPQRESYRLPKERDNGGMTGIFVLTKGGKFYPISLFLDGYRQINTDTILWHEIGEGQRPELLSDRGWGPDLATNVGFERFLRQLPRDRYYLSFIVWPDSFAEFRQIKQECSRRGIDVGFELTTGAIPSFGSKGTGPAPRL